MKMMLRRLFVSKCLPDNADSLEPKPATLTFTIICKSQCKSKSRNLSQETAICDKEFDSILKDSSLKERRLNIAAMETQGIIANHDMARYLSDLGHEEAVAAQALLYADALIAMVNH